MRKKLIAFSLLTVSIVAMLLLYSKYSKYVREDVTNDAVLLSDPSTGMQDISSQRVEEKERDLFDQFEYFPSFRHRSTWKRKRRRRKGKRLRREKKPFPAANATTTLLQRTTPVNATANDDRFPRFLIIGFAKTGTKALYEVLKLHPKLAGPRKEVRYFSRRITSETLQDYLERFPHPPLNGYTIEKSPDYILSQSAPVKLKEAARQVGANVTELKFIIMLRNPVARTVSDYLEMQVWNLENGHKTFPPFSKFIMTDTNQVDSGQYIINGSCYIYHIERWLKHFNAGQVCFVNGDNFIIDPYKEIKILEHCLNIEPYFLQSHFAFNAGKGFYCFRINSGVSAPALCMNPGKGREHPYISEDIITKLKYYFKPWNERLYPVVNRHFDWETSMKY